MHTYFACMALGFALGVLFAAAGIWSDQRKGGRRQMNEYISVLRRQPEDIRAGAAPFAVYVDGELWCECEDYFSVAEKLTALLPERGRRG